MRLLPSSALVLTWLMLFSHDAANAVQQQNADWTPDKPLTGRALPCEGGRIKGFDCSNVELLSYLPAATLGGSTGYDLWGWTDSATGREFAIVGGAATAFVEVTDPANPKYLGTLPPHEGVTEHAAQSVKVYKNHAFIAYESANHGMQVFDLTQLRDVKNAPAVFKETAHYPNFANAHTITLDQESGFAYPTGISDGGETCGGGLHMIDVRTPTKPTFAGCFTEPATGGLNGDGYIHDSNCLMYRGPDQQYKGHEICLNSSGGSLGIADVTDKQHPKTISIGRYPNIGYTHQGWFTEDQRYFFIDDELDEGNMAQALGQDKVRTRTIVFDLNDLDDPVVLTEYYATTSATDHNLYIHGRYMYQANYEAGLRIVDVADPKNPKEVGYLTNAGSAWTTYPFFKDGVVGVSMDSGLFLARLKTK